MDSERPCSVPLIINGGTLTSARKYDLQLSLIARGVGLGLVPKARWKACPFRKDLKILEPHDFRLFVTPAIATLTGHGRFGPVIDLLASGIENVDKKHNVK